MFRRSQAKSLDELGVNIPAQTTFSGELRTNTNIRVAGLVQNGLLDTTGNVLIAPTARVECTIQAKAVSIQGSFSGTLRAERVEILAGSQVDGKLYVKNYYTEKGAKLTASILAFEAEAVQLGLHFPAERNIPVVQLNGNM